MPAGDRRARRPRLLIVEGPDADRRIELMRELDGAFAVAAVGSDPGVAEAVEAAGFEFHAYPLRRAVSPLTDVRAVVRLYRLFRRLRPDIVHTFGTKPGVWARLAARRAGVPVVTGTVTGLGSLYVNDGLRTRVLRAAFRPLQRAACRLSDATVFQNARDARDFVDTGVVAAERAVVVLGSGIATERLTPARVPPPARIVTRAELGAEPGSVVVTMVARLIRSKGVLEFAEAADRVKRRHPGAQFVLVGPDDRESVERLSPSELERVRRSVRWIGPRGDVPAILAASDVFVLPSYREGLARVLLEAAAMRLPLVTTRCPGCREVVEEERNGLLVAPGDPEPLAEAIARLVAEPRLRRAFGAASREVVVRQFDVSAVAAQLAALYRELLDAPAEGPLSMAFVTATAGGYDARNE